MNRTAILLFIAAAVLLAVSCATAPKPTPVETVAVETAPVEKPPEAAAAPLPEAEYKRAQELREVISRNGLDRYAPEAFQTAEAGYKDGEASYNKDNAKSKTALDKAIAGYQQVIDSGFPVLTREKKSEADSAKAEADALKAPVAMKAEYAAALEVYNQALKARDDKQFEKSLELLRQAKTLFTDIAGKTREKKTRAEKAISEVQQGLKQAEAQAAEAEQAKEGGL